ncbi:MAG: 3',5'-cyclic-AMP phosphodiesterase [Gammaproteobacteria bacterium]|nr:3',5'-cyclic-AMP phosphodiesterase [Gammaproteobacteria bacterium]
MNEVVTNEAVLRLNHTNPQILQFSDLHLSERDELMGINCDESFAAVKALAAQYHQISVTLLTGDISQDNSETSYRKCAEIFRNSPHPVAWITGNHDDVAMQQQFLNQGAISTTKRIVFRHWQLLLLNSQVAGKVFGEINQDQLQSIKQAAIDYPDHHLMLVMHHHPVPMNSEWIDNHRLMNQAQLWQVVSEVPQVKSIIFGHVHQEVNLIKNDVRVLGVPSTSVQFTPNVDEFNVDTQQPGFRFLELLANGKIKTKVHRVKDGKFVADFDPNGY